MSTNTDKFNFLIGCVPDWMQESGVTVTAGSEETALPDDNLTDTDINKVWRAQGASERADNCVQIDLGVERPVSSIALVNHNATGGSTWRVRGDTAAIGTNAVRHPNALVVHAGSPTGAYTDIDEGCDGADDGNDLTLGSGGAVLLHFQNPPSNLALGEDLQVFRIRANSALSNSDIDTLELKLYEGAMYLETLGTIEVQGTPSEIYSIPWDATSLSDQTGAGVQLRIEHTASTGFYQTDIATVDWVYELDSDSTDYDSGWMPLVGPLVAFGALPVSGLGGRSVLQTGGHFTVNGTGDLTTQTLQHWRVDTRFEKYTESSEYLQAGRLAIGLSSPDGLPLEPGWSIGGEDLTTRQTSKGGQDWIDPGPFRRTARLPLNYSFSEALSDIYEGIIRRFGQGVPFLASILPQEGKDSLSWWGTLDGVSEMRNSVPNASQFTTDLRLREQL